LLAMRAETDEVLAGANTATDHVALLADTLANSCRSGEQAPSSRNRRSVTTRGRTPADVGAGSVNSLGGPPAAERGSGRGEGPGRACAYA
jgi:hypothetical protein